MSRKGSSGRRTSGGNGATKITKTQEQEFKKAGGDGVIVNVQNGMTVNASDSDAIEKLRDMAARNEIPQFVHGSRDDLGRWYEEFDRLYDIPSGDLGRYAFHLWEGSRRDILIDFENDGLTGKLAGAKLAHDFSKASQAEISGAVKFAVYVGRDALGTGLVFRAGGWPDISLRQKYGAVWSRIFSNTEKSRISREMEDYITQRLGSPLTRQEKRAINEDAWRRVDDGWIRIDT